MPRPSALSYDLQGSFVESGGTGYAAEGYVNVPINDRMAVRLVGWYEHTPGYIDNVQGTQYYPTSDTTLDNTGRTKKNYNDVDIYGARAALKIDLNDSWSITPAVMGQETKTNGVFCLRRQYRRPAGRTFLSGKFAGQLDPGRPHY